MTWTGRGKIVKVEVSTDAGRNWLNANLQDPVLDKAHTGFRFLAYRDGETTEIKSRATDETGYIQPTLQQLLNARGVDMGAYHLNRVMSWLIKKDGSVVFKPEKWK